MAAAAPTSALAKSVLAWLQAPATASSVNDDAKRAELSKAADALATAFDLDTSASAPGGPGLAQIYDIFLRTQSKLSGASAGAAPAAAATAGAAGAASTSTSEAAPAAAAASAAAVKKQEVSEADKAKAEQAKAEGNKAMSSKDYGGAIAAYDEAIEHDPTNPVYYSNRAAAYSQIQQHDKAIEDASMAKELDPSFARAYSRLGHALFSAGRFQEAVEAYEAGLAIDPSNAVMKNGLEASRKQVGGASSSSSAASPSSAADSLSREGGLPGAGPGGLGAFPGFGGENGGGAGGMPDLGALLNNPQLMQMMGNGGLEGLMNNPMLRNLMNDPNMQQMARNMMRGAGGGGAGGGAGAGGAGNMFG
ncbi:hypothetical protein A4X06_0g1755 [Tilletia controversa]|uniref:SGTA homodimerisation domain-containing protein n=2 Tax=Tilletia TaxID=13289 RepID=A0A8X7MWZ5_9BASI|nr:hypothetical protein CF335_g5418 [Tilletia laevis]KAE8253027.1 hypothetical protein A4X06_0g1755 [Tilletia controversa]KAE8261715.1 hypothetical protein A4X03_0g3023 [Tilletia caries]